MPQKKNPENVRLRDFMHFESKYPLFCSSFKLGVRMMLEVMEEYTEHKAAAPIGLMTDGRCLTFSFPSARQGIAESYSISIKAAILVVN